AGLAQDLLRALDVPPIAGQGVVGDAADAEQRAQDPRPAGRLHAVTARGAQARRPTGVARGLTNARVRRTMPGKGGANPDEPRTRPRVVPRHAVRPDAGLLPPPRARLPH